MRLRLIAAGTRMPDWVSQGYQTYAKRLGRDCPLELVEVPLGRRSASADPAKARVDEGARMLARCQPGDRVVALEVTGKQMSTVALAAQMEEWRRDGRDVALLVGGPDGLDEACLRRADMRWSLSKLTLPHGMVRVLLAEQIYRAWAILNRHPYHRA